MNTLIFATNNQYKVEEMKSITKSLIRVISLKEAGINIEISEPHETLEANAVEKSQTIYRLTIADCFSEDTGLEAEALNGEPGVKSARYAGEGRSAEDNIKKVLTALGLFENRRARFRTVISLIFNGTEHLFTGICNGRIANEPKGTNGFGYDSVFIPDGSAYTFGEMNLAEKNYFSHRRKATDQLIAFLSQTGNKL